VLAGVYQQEEMRRGEDMFDFEAMCLFISRRD
jgi:hypothetical protein